MNNYLPTDYQAFIHTSRYARWLEEEGRRESWSETVNRYITGIVDQWTTPTVRDEIRDAILSLEVMPSMRAMMTSGPAFERDKLSMKLCSSSCVVLVWALV